MKVFVYILLIFTMIQSGKVFAQKMTISEKLGQKSEYTFELIGEVNLIDLLSNQEQDKMKFEKGTKFYTVHNGIREEVGEITEDYDLLEMYRNNENQSPTIDKFFMGYNLLRGHIKQIYFAWQEYNPQELVIYQIDMTFAQELERAIRDSIFRQFQSWSLRSTLELHKHSNRQLKGIIIETDKHYIFIGITSEHGFHLGRWNVFDNVDNKEQSLYFYSPSLSYALKAYLNKYPIRGFSNQLNYGVLSGESEITKRYELHIKK